jgi:hypothetical protein
MLFCAILSIYPSSDGLPYTLSWRSDAMPYSAGASLPEHRIKASIDSVDSSNRIQDNDYARHYGFRAGLVPGVSIFAYMSRPLIEMMGRDWLERGSAEVHFLRPIYEGEEIHVSGSITSVASDGTLSLDYKADNNQGAACGIGVAKLPPQRSMPEPSLEDYPPGRTKLHRSISLETLQVGEPLTPLTSEFTWNIHWQYCRKAIRDHHPLYERIMHPGWLANRASQILAANYSIQADRCVQLCAKPAFAGRGMHDRDSRTRVRQIRTGRRSFHRAGSCSLCPNPLPGHSPIHCYLPHRAQRSVAVGSPHTFECQFIHGCSSPHSRGCP